MEGLVRDTEYWRNIWKGRLGILDTDTNCRNIWRDRLGIPTGYKK